MPLLAAAPGRAAKNQAERSRAGFAFGGSSNNNEFALSITWQPSAIASSAVSDVQPFLLEGIMINTTSSLDSALARPVQPASAQNTAGVANARAKGGPEAGPHASARDRLNVQILQSSMEVSIGAGDKSQTLLFRAAIERINELLAPTLGPDALQGVAGQDNSAEATAETILSLSTGFFDAYAAQRPNDDPDEVARDFVALIRGGFEKGFNEARDILEGLDVFTGDIESGVMKTFDLVQKGLDDFLAGKLTPRESDAKAV